MCQIPSEKTKDIIELVRLTSIMGWCANVMGCSAKNRMPSDAFIEKLIGPFDEILSHEDIKQLVSFYKSDVMKKISKNIQDHSFLQKVGILSNIPLSPREFRVVTLILQGYSAREIAFQIHLSKRTVEHHIERIKERLGCFSKVELIQKARELEAFGYLSGFNCLSVASVMKPLSSLE